MAEEKTKEYIVSWTDLRGRQCEVRVTDTKVASGRSVSLVAGSSPFVVSGDDSEDPMYPVRVHGAQLSVIGDYSLLGELEFTSVTRYRVQLKREGEVKWQGWLKCDVLSQRYESTKNELVFDCIDDIEATKAFDISSSDWEKTMPNGEVKEFPGKSTPMSVIDIICECLAHVSYITGEDDLKIVFPREAVDIEPFWELFVNKAVFFEESEIDIEDKESVLYSPMTCYEVLEEVCRCAGWCCQQWGKVVYFMSPVNTDEQSPKIGWHAWHHVIIRPDWENIPFRDDYKSGGSHTISMLSGVHKLCMQVRQESVSELGFDVGNGARLVADEGVIDRTTGKLKSFTMTNPRVKTHGFDMVCDAKDFGTFRVVEKEHDPRGYFSFWSNRQRESDKTTNYDTDYWATGSCGVCKADIFETRDINYDYKFGIFTSVHYPTQYYYVNNGAWRPTNWKAMGNQLAFAELDFGSFTFIDGALSLELSITPFGCEAKHLAKHIPIAVTFGDYSFNPNGGNEGATAEWVYNGGNALVFEAEVDENGRVLKSTKTINDPYNGAEGLLMPMTFPLSGELKVVFYGINTRDIGNERLTTLGYMYTDIKMTYTPHDNDSPFDAKKLVNYRSYSKDWVEDGMTVGLKLHSYRDKVSDDGLLLKKEGTFLPVENMMSWRGIEERPEEALLAKYEDYYFSVREEIVLELSGDDEVDFPCMYWTPDSRSWQNLGCVGFDYGSGVSRWLFVQRDY